MRFVSLAVGLFLVASTVASAADGRFGRTAIGIEGGSGPQDVFTPDTSKIVLSAEILDMPAGTTLTATWIAVKTEVAPANFQITSADTATKQAVTSDVVTFFMTKPDAGWPVGDYKVDLSINGNVATSVPFTIAK